MRLQKGVQKFRANVFPSMQQEFEHLENGQSPETLFITCSDSRIDPNLITQTNPGELFVVRNAGNIVPRPGSGEIGVVATIEYAVNVLNVKDVIVCGHSQCGAVNGLLNLESLANLHSVREWVLRSEEILKDIPASDNRLADAIKANVQLQLRNLREFPFIEQAVNESRLNLEGWVYHIGSGNIELVN